MVRLLEDIHQRGGTQIFMATTAIMPSILPTTPTILSTPPCLATGTITALPGRGAVMTRSQLVEWQPRILVCILKEEPRPLGVTGAQDDRASNRGAPSRHQSSASSTTLG